MRPHPVGLAPSPDFISDLEHWADHEPSLRHCEVAFYCHEPLIDSAEAAPDHWWSLAQELRARSQSFDSAVVLHGTDTLAYTASALSFLLRGLRKPIILTGSQVPFSQPPSDAPENLRGAMHCALIPELAEVCVFFDSMLLRGNRTRKWSTRMGESFASPHWPPLALVKARTVLNPAALLLSTTVVDAPVPLRAVSIGLLKLYPGIPERVLAAAVDAHPDGVVLELYGSGTGPTLDRAFIRQLEAAASRKVPLVGVSQCAHGALGKPSYPSSRHYRDLGIISGHDLTPEAALTKLHYLHAASGTGSDMPAAVPQPLAGELTPPP